MPTKITTDEFITKAIGVHSNRYEYNEVTYINTNTPITIICKIHGVFTQTPKQHLSGSGCKTCGRDNTNQSNNARRKTTLQFIQNAHTIHKGQYDYSKSVYLNAHTKLEIICKEHGSFFQTPSNHLFDQCGCPFCYTENEKTGSIYTKHHFKINPDLTKLDGILYLIKFSSEQEQFLKFGITKRSVHKRFRGYPYNQYKIKEICIKHGRLVDLFEMEQSLISLYKQHRYNPTPNKFGGRRECIFYSDELIHQIKGEIQWD